VQGQALANAAADLVERVGEADLLLRGLGHERSLLQVAGQDERHLGQLAQHLHPRLVEA
jgi:hypothetical protein